MYVMYTHVGTNGIYSHINIYFIIKTFTSVAYGIYNILYVTSTSRYQINWIKQKKKK